MQSEQRMAALSRRPDLAPRKKMTFDDGTLIEEHAILVSTQREIQKNKQISDEERGYHLLAARILVNGQNVVYDDLMECFTTDELEVLMRFVFPDAVAAAEKELAESSKNG